jgi:hypothetical protein
MSDPISLGDLVAALHRLQPSPEAEATIARLLGFRTAGAKQPTTSARPQPAASEQRATAPQTTETGVETEEQFLPSADAFELTSSESGTQGSVRLLSGVQPLERPSPHLEPLFRPRWTRHLISGALSTNGNTGSIDFGRLCEAVARLQPVVRLPRRLLPTLKRGVQVLVDQGEGMQPFIQDQEQILHWIARVVGKDKATIMGFAGSPLRGAGASLRREWREYRTPPANTPVLLLSDLGIHRSSRWSEWADEAEWLEFVKILSRSGNPLAVLVPYGPDRWPTALRTAIKIIPWDERTTISRVRSAIGHTIEAEK